MAPDDSSLQEFVEAVSKDSGLKMDPRSAREIARPVGKVEVADATLALTVTASGQDALVLLVSNPAFPEMVAEAVDMADQVAGHLSTATGARVLRPVARGYVEGRSYAAYHRFEPPSDNRMIRHVQKRLSAHHIVGWLTDIALETRRPVADEEITPRFVAPLAALAEDDDMPEPLRRHAGARADTVARMQALVSIVEHGDFWLGNILFHPRLLPFAASARGDFSVIDWRGARFDGYPAIDLIRYALSSRPMGAARTAQDLDRYRHALSLSRDQIAVSVLAAIGWLGLHREEFPKPRYVAMASDVHRCLVLHGYIQA